MMRRTAARLNALAILAALTVPVLTVPVLAQERIALRATSVLPKEVDEVLWSLVEPDHFMLKPSEKMEDVLRQRCGSISVAWRENFEKLNEKSRPFDSRSKEVTIEFPACARVRKNDASKLAEVRPADDAAILLKRELGASRSTKLPTCTGKEQSDQDCPMKTALEVIADQLRPAAVPSRFDEMAKPPSTLWLPFSSYWTILTLKVGKTADGAISDLRDAAKVTTVGPDLLDVQPAPPAALIAPLARDDESVVRGSCAEANKQGDDWPFNRRLVREALETGLAFRPPGTAPVTIRVADTGFERLGVTPGFALPFLAVDQRGKDVTRDDGGYLKAYFGFNADSGGVVTPFQEDLTGWHGTAVADLALGTDKFRTEFPRLSELIHLTGARVFTSRGGIWPDIAAMQMSIQYQPLPASVINFSVGGDLPMKTFESELETLSRSKKLVVFAAGNDGNTFRGGSSFYPPSYAADDELPRGNMIVVGAHAPSADGVIERAKFSRYDAPVDLLAPGCLIPAAFGEQAYRAGTSFAAPLVSFTAALIEALVPDAAPKNVRARLWASSRWVSKEIGDHTVFGGILDIPVALRVFDDVVRLRDGSLRIGRWKRERSLDLCRDEPAIDLATLLRIRVEPGLSPVLRLLRRWPAQQGKVEDNVPDGCTPTSPSLTLQPEAGAPIKLFWKDIEAVIPSYNWNKRRGDPAPIATPTIAAPLAAPGVALGQVIADLKAIAPPPTTAQPASEEVKVIQSALQAAGIDLEADGLPGKKTVSAIRTFQLNRRESPTGKLSSVQADALVAAVAAAPKPQP